LNEGLSPVNFVRVTSKMQGEEMEGLRCPFHLCLSFYAALRDFEPL